MAACPACGTEGPEAAKFCAECGERLTAVDPPERFRRTVTILFSDVVGSTALGERLDPETLARVMGDYFEAVKPVVVRHGGTLAAARDDAISQMLWRTARAGLLAARGEPTEAVSDPGATG